MTGGLNPTIHLAGLRRGRAAGIIAAVLLAACAGGAAPLGEGATPVGVANAGFGVLKLREMVDAVPPFTLGEGLDQTLDVLSGSLELREDSTFSLILELVVHSAGGSSRMSWRADGTYRRLGAGEVEYVSNAFDGGTAAGTSDVAGALSLDVREGRLVPGPWVSATFSFVVNRYTYGPWPYTFQ